MLGKSTTLPSGTSDHRANNYLYQAYLGSNAPRLARSPLAR